MCDNFFKILFLDHGKIKEKKWVFVIIFLIGILFGILVGVITTFLFLKRYVMISLNGMSTFPPWPPPPFPQTNIPMIWIESNRICIYVTLICDLHCSSRCIQTVLYIVYTQTIGLFSFFIARSHLIFPSTFSSYISKNLFRNLTCKYHISSNCRIKVMPNNIITKINVFWTYLKLIYCLQNCEVRFSN